MTFPYKHILLIGATSGIGKAMADRFISENIQVTAVGRRQERLDEFSHPTIDCVFLNAGTQSIFDFSKPETVDLSNFNREMNVNFTSFVALTHAMLPHLLAQNNSAFIYTGTQISLVPAFLVPAYSASKAALDAFIMSLREQLRYSKVQVFHISPGPVQTEIHDTEMGEERGRKFGMSLEDCTNVAYSGLVEGENDIFPGNIGGSTKEQYGEIIGRRNEAFERLTKLVRGLY
ncbi:hypothetical protein B0J11DRAFT_431887 [Dendryphion nanum]|uniref:NAD(P)-binding protein n=1 Tax=Dendryphion nanum TaxID=256645 RepID=A0A9P9IR75_9PLEO|nr:hypothetical protein B0J11DRAFT_431887 [Dendryphion nanum]